MKPKKKQEALYNKKQHTCLFRVLHFKLHFKRMLFSQWVELFRYDLELVTLLQTVLSQSEMPAEIAAQSELQAEIVIRFEICADS